MKKIMFICHGNICRSPMAEFIFKNLAKQKGVADDLTVASSATSTEEIFGGVGNPVYPPARAELLRHGIDPGGKRAVQLKKDDYEKYDLLVCMDSNNVRNALKILGDDREGKLSLLLSHAGESRDVSDPWYTGKFDIAYADIYKGCKALLDELTKE